MLKKNTIITNNIINILGCGTAYLQNVWVPKYYSPIYTVTRPSERRRCFLICSSKIGENAQHYCGRASKV